MKGRKAKPTSLKLLQGNPGHRPIGDVMTKEPQPERSGMREPPAHITGAAREFWFSQGPQFVQMGTLTDADWPVFETLCLMHEELLSLTARINKLRAKAKLTDADDNRLMTLEGRRRKAIGHFQKLSTEFGGTASARTRVRIPSGQDEFPFARGSTPPPENSLDAARRQLAGA